MATHNNTLQHTATHCNTMQTHVIWQHTAIHCKSLQRTATHCNTLQHTAIHCNTLQVSATQQQHTATHCNSRYFLLQTRNKASCNTLQQTATHCNTLQHTATPCNTLQHTATAATSGTKTGKRHRVSRSRPRNRVVSGCHRQSVAVYHVWRIRRFCCYRSQKRKHRFFFFHETKDLFFLCVCATDPPKQNFVRSPLLCIVSPYLLIYGDNILCMTVCGAVPYLRRFSEISPK